MDIHKLVTVIIPTYNRKDKLADAIQSVLDQTYSNIEIIVVDDGSIDGTAALVAQFPTVGYFYKNNGGQASARNLGLHRAKGTIISSLDSDDIWHADFLTKCVEKLESDHLDFVFANWEQETKQGSKWDFLNNDPFLTQYFSKEKNGWIDLTYDEVRSLFIRSCPSPSSSVVVRKSSIIAGWDEDMNIGDDWCMYLEMILTKKCNVSFTLDRLWRKRVDDINVYDGRKWSEVLELLHIADLSRSINKFRNLLTKEEFRIFNERYMSSLVELSKHKLIREFHLLEAMRLLQTSMSISFPFTLKTIPKIFFLGLSRKIADMRRKSHS